MKRIHIVSSGPRTGSTLLSEAMVSCFKIDHYCEHEATVCSFLPSSGNCFLTKNPGGVNSVRLPLLLNPNLYVICIIRDPRDSIVSFHGARPDIYYTGLRWWKLFVKKFDKLNTHSRFIPIKYEDLVRKPDQVQEQLIRKMPFLEKKHDFSQYHLVAETSEISEKALNDVRPISPKGVGKWKDHLPRIKQQIAIHGSISDDLIKFDYEKDKEWKKVLSEVEAEGFNQERPEFLSLTDRFNCKKREFLEVAKISVRRFGLDPKKIF